MSGYIDERTNAAKANCPNKPSIRWHSMHCACDECLEADAYVCYHGMPLAFIDPPVSVRELESHAS